MNREQRLYQRFKGQVEPEKIAALINAVGIDVAEQMMTADWTAPATKAKAAAPMAQQVRYKGAALDLFALAVGADQVRR